MADEKTEKPTEKKLKKSREKGQIVRSKDLALAAASIAATVAAARFGGWLVVQVSDRLARDLAQMGEAPLKEVTGGDIQQVVFTGSALLAMTVGPIALATMTAGVITHGFQGGWSFAPGAMTLKWSRLNPANGIKQFGIMRAGADTVKTLTTVAVIAYLLWLAVGGVAADGARLAWVSPVSAGRSAWQHAEQLLWRVAWALAILSVADYALQRYRLMSQLKMSKQEVRQEAKDGDGSAEIKGKIRQIQRNMSRRRMMKDVARATVVITNPTHFAVALRYERATMSAPVVLAKGQDLVALRIREKARQHGITIIENKPLAQTLFKTAEIGATIPAPLFNAVAEVLAYLVRIKQVKF